MVSKATRRKEDRDTVNTMKQMFLEAAAKTDATPWQYRKALLLAAMESGRHVKVTEDEG